MYGGLFLVLWDFNCVQQEGTVSTTLIRSADEACLGTPATTKPLGTRRIDFALAHPDLVACREHTFCTLRFLITALFVWTLALAATKRPCANLLFAEALEGTARPAELDGSGRSFGLG